MSKVKAEVETNWVEVDKRIRARRPTWTLAEAETLDQGLRRLPDVTAKADTMELEQPAIGPRAGGLTSEPEGSGREPDASN
jgi:hypothetical protein